MVKLAKWSLVLLGMLSSSCSTAYLAQIDKTRSDYNESLTNSEDSQFLLNIVRVHFGFSPYFVGVDSVTSQSTIKAGVENSETRLFQSPNAAAGGTPFWSISPIGSLTVSPVVTYSPVQGSKFVSALLSPIDLKKVFLLERVIGISSVLRLTVQQIGVLDNASNLSSISSKKLPDYQEFNTFANTLEQLVEDDSINVEMSSYESNPAILLYMNNDEAAAKIATLLHLTHPYKTILLTMFVLKHNESNENIIHIQTRSYYNVLQLLANGVESPDGDIKRYGIQKKLVSNNGREVLLKDLTNNLIDVHVSDKKPENALLKVYYQDKWYYILDQDNYSKSTVVSLRLMYSLLIGEYQPNLPVLTIPVK